MPENDYNLQKSKVKLSVTDTENTFHLAKPMISPNSLTGLFIIREVSLSWGFPSWKWCNLHFSSQDLRKEGSVPSFAACGFCLWVVTVCHGYFSTPKPSRHPAELEKISTTVSIFHWMLPPVLFNMSEILLDSSWNLLVSKCLWKPGLYFPGVFGGLTSELDHGDWGHGAVRNTVCLKVGNPFPPYNVPQ